MAARSDGYYLWQDNLDQTPTTKVVTLQVEVMNAVVGNTIKMVGSSMSSVFDAIEANAQTQITTSTEHLAALDVNIVSVSESKTVLTTRVAITNLLLGNMCNQLDHQTYAFWPMIQAAAENIRSCASLVLPKYPVAKGAFYPQAAIWTDPSGNGKRCRSISPFVCLFGTEFDTFTAGPTEYEWFHDQQAPIAVQIMDELEAQIPGVPIPGTFLLKTSITVGFYHTENPYFNYYAVNKAVWRYGPVYNW